MSAKPSPSARGYNVAGGRYLHREIAERALGKPLPPKAVVHHVDGAPSHNKGGNFVICPDQKYHFLLHKRERALHARYPAHFLRCNYCKEYGDLTAMYVYEKAGTAIHVTCQAIVNRERQLTKPQKRKEQQCPQNPQL